MSQEFSLKWNIHMHNIIEAFKNFLSSEEMVDVTLACEGRHLKAHKIVLSACSPFFHSLFLENPCKHPIVILKDMKYAVLKAIIEFVYHGEVNVAEDQLSVFMDTANTLQIKGLSASTNGDNPTSNQDVLSKRTVSVTHEVLGQILESAVDETSEDVPASSQEQSSNVEVQEANTPPKWIRDLSRKRSVGDHTREEMSRRKKKPQHFLETEQFPSNMQTRRSLNLPAVSSGSIQTTSSTKKNSVCNRYRQQKQEQTFDEGANQSFPAEANSSAVPPQPPEETSNKDNIPSQSVMSSFQSKSISSKIQELPNNNREDSISFISVPLDVAGRRLEKSPCMKSEPLELVPYESLVESSQSRNINDTTKYTDQSSLLDFPGSSASSDSTTLSFIQSLAQDNGIKASEVDARNLSFSSISKSRNVKNVQRKHCSYCSYSTPHFTLLKRHIRTHTGEKPYSCRFCGKTFNDKSGLSRHIRIHTGEKPYACNACSKKFNSNSDLIRHMMIHTGEKPYTCSVCGKNFTRRNILEAHARLHTGERPYACSVCPKTFTRKDYLSKHFATHAT